MTDDAKPAPTDTTPNTPTIRSTDQPNASLPPVQSRLKMSHLLMLISAFIFSIISLSAAGWGAWQFYQLNTNLTDPTNTRYPTQSQLDDLETKLHNILTGTQNERVEHQQRLQQIQQAFNQQTQQLNRQQQQLAQLEARWQSAFKSTQLERQIERIASLLNDAQRQLFLTQSIPHTRHLLEAAHSECIRTKARYLDSICQSIHQDLQRLSSAQIADHSHIIQQLDQLRIWLNQGLFANRRLSFDSDLPIYEPLSAMPQEPELMPDNMTDRWQLALNRLGYFFRTHIVRIHDVQPNGLFHLTHDQATSLLQQTALLIQQARSAVVLKDPQLYQDALTELARITQTHKEDFQLHYEDTRTLLHSLKQVSITLPKDLTFKATLRVNEIRESLAHRELNQESSL